MILTVGLFLAAFFGPLDEAEAALSAGRIEQSGKMVQQLASEGVSGPRFDRLRAGQALAAGRYDQSLALYAKLAVGPYSLTSDREGAAVSAYRLGNKAGAKHWVDQAMGRPDAGWRVYNLCGILADEASQFDAADTCYERSEALAPGRPEIANNRGWSLLLRGQWKDAGTAFEQALAIDPSDRVARSNLDLARDALASDLPVRKSGESDADYARRLNDAGVMAEAAGARDRAIAAFSNSIDVRPTWSAVAARNLEEAQRP